MLVKCYRYCRPDVTSTSNKHRNLESINKIISQNSKFATFSLSWGYILSAM